MSPAAATDLQTVYIYSILESKRRDRIRYEVIRDKLDQNETILNRIKKKRLIWYPG